MANVLFDLGVVDMSSSSEEDSETATGEFVLEALAASSLLLAFLAICFSGEQPLCLGRFPFVGWAVSCSEKGVGVAHLLGVDLDAFMAKADSKSLLVKVKLLLLFFFFGCAAMMARGKGEKISNLSLCDKTREMINPFTLLWLL